MCLSPPAAFLQRLRLCSKGVMLRSIVKKGMRTSRKLAAPCRVFSRGMQFKHVSSLILSRKVYGVVRR